MPGRLSRRQVLALAAATSADLRAQGVASRGVRAQPRAKASGLPFRARFTDVAREAGLTQPTIYGSADDPRFILETIGCGAAFLDYDNDGWLDIFILNGRLVDGIPPGAILDPALARGLMTNMRDGRIDGVGVIRSPPGEARPR